MLVREAYLNQRSCSAGQELMNFLGASIRTAMPYGFELLNIW